MAYEKDLAFRQVAAFNFAGVNDYGDTIFTYLRYRTGR
jgi:hypothetical protein